MDLYDRKLQLEAELDVVNQELTKRKAKDLKKLLKTYEELKKKMDAVLEKIEDVDIKTAYKLRGWPLRVLDCPTGRCTFNSICGTCDPGDW